MNDAASEASSTNSLFFIVFLREKEMSPSVRSLRILHILFGASLVIGMALLSGCGGSDGQSGAPGVSTGTVSGVVTSDGTNALSGVVVANNLTPDTATTDSAGNYTLSLPTGTYTLTFTAKNYTP